MSYTWQDIEQERQADGAATSAATTLTSSDLSRPVKTSDLH
jgi:hypothetical protein